jgi:hypothetical protein
MTDATLNWLVDQHNLDGPECIRVDPDWGDWPRADNPAVLCVGIMPNTNQRGEYFAGYLAELESACQQDYSHEMEEFDDWDED